MRQIYRTNRLTIRVLGIIEFFLIAAPPAAAFFFSDDWLEILLSAGIILLAYSPLIILLGRLLYKYSTIKIIVTGEFLHYESPSAKLAFNWSDVRHIRFDYIQIENKRAGTTQSYQLYEIVAGENKIRFLVSLGSSEIERVDEFSVVNNLSKKAFLFDSYGIFLTRKDSASLLSYLQNYTGLELERERGLF